MNFSAHTPQSSCNSLSHTVRAPSSHTALAALSHTALAPSSHTVPSFISHTALAALSHTALASFSHTALPAFSHTALAALSHTALAALSHTALVAFSHKALAALSHMYTALAPSLTQRWQGFLQLHRPERGGRRPAGPRRDGLSEVSPWRGKKRVCFKATYAVCRRVFMPLVS